MKLIIDTDPGIDDAMAIAYAAAAPEIDLIGLTTVFGNTYVHQSSRNARFLLHKLGLDLHVAEGAAVPIGADTHAPSEHVHGREGFGDLTEIPEIGENHALPAAAFLVEMARAHKGELVVCAVGPLTNIANAMRLDPEFAGNLRELVIMGGAVYCPGNITRHAEANIYHDALAAEEVFSAPPNTVLVGLDVTLKTLYETADFEALAQKSPDMGAFLRDISRFYLKFYKEIGGLEGCGLHDSTAVIACSHQPMFDMVETGLRVVTEGDQMGATQPDPERPAIRVCRDVDGAGVVRLFTDRVSSLP
ncbi:MULTISPECIES: nucleoside hydrolase [unclassified Ruegeria]|uniref:nucleoside hydrolase n=1 Tax=unclassified Ruegeria TaxID=2625375 RepID=UPI0014891CE9|nr:MULTISPECIES: nucleoside hydrolase [unclassified Ruegeria]NOD75274.1 nucleoside hydrolase [Ruegeria sp. HKCCD4332]NOD87235.1 nucleoside hydrolase [Ruegeria sp. HKCCD4318]NOE12790.1 nucleoside hydrolase [Ruegeria sp. HKCCD4318-2]NOG09044.1 nucleoside hydrolase [Ruegeria sp. HKCCD4315]